MQHSVSAPRMPARPGEHAVHDAAADDGWNELHSLPKPLSLKKPFKPSENVSRTEVSAISEARGLPVGGGGGARARMRPIGFASEPLIGVDNGVGRSSSNPTLPRINARGQAGGTRPSNRSEAVALAQEFQRRLETVPNRSHEALKSVHDEAFKIVTEQVTSHCSERGDVLEQLRQFYTKSVDVTARLAEKATRNELTARIRELETRIADLEVENQRLSERQLSSDPEVVIMSLFRELKPHKKARTMGVLYAEAGQMLMRVDSISERLHSAADQAALINQLLLSHTEEQRAAVVQSLMAISPLTEQYRLLRRLLGAMPMGDQIKMSMEILVPEQHRRIMLGIFDTAPSEQEKAALLLDALHTMVPAKLAKTLGFVLSAVRSTDLLASMRLTVAALPHEDAVSFIAETVALLDHTTSARSIVIWLTDLLAKAERAEQEAERRAQREASTNFVNTAPAEEEETTTEAVLSMAHELLQEFVRLLGYDVARDAFGTLIAEAEDKLPLLAKLIDDVCGTSEELGHVLRDALNEDPLAVQVPELAVALGKHLLETRREEGRTWRGSHGV